MESFRIRDAELPKDKPDLLEFIMGSQRFESAIEPDRRLDDAVAAEYFDVLATEVATRDGRTLVAEGRDGRLLGWGVVYTIEGEAFIVPEERTFGYISELFVIEPMRGKGVGQALIAACEEWARALKLRVLQIGVLAGNTRADTIYRRAGFAPYALELKKYL